MMSTTPRQPQNRPTSEDTATALLDIVQQLVVELHPQRVTTVSVTLDSALEQALGLDSLGQAELLSRLERAFDVHLPEQLLATMETPRDLLRAVQGASTGGTPQPPPAGRRQRPAQAQAIPLQATTLVEVLEWHMRAHPQRLHVCLYEDTGHTEDITYAALYEGAMAIAAGLQAHELPLGQTVALMLPTSRSFLESYVGILLAGGIPVPIYPPMRQSQLEEHLRRQASILTSARVTMLLTIPAAKPLARLLQAQVSGLQSVVTPADVAAPVDAYVRLTVQAQDIAFVQYTSGSTGTPKGVMLTHANLLANIRAMHQVMRTTSTDVFVSWLPLYHDMGLIGAWLGSLYTACPLVLMSPLTFLVRPERWLWAIHQHHGTLSGGPNFGYELCLRRIADRHIAGLDLSSWRLAFNGAEPVSPDTVRRFSARFASYGFRPEAMTPVYGLAENALGLALPPPARGPRVDHIQREPFMRTGQAIPAAADDAKALRFVACGQPLPGHQIRLVDATGFEVSERQEGRLEFQGPSATSGYLHNAEATRQLFHGDWLDAGDLAYYAEGDLYITGRTKDLIIRAGRNVYPQELEEAVGNLPGIRTGCVAVFGSLDPASGTERLIVLAETRETDPTALQALRRQIDTLSVDLLATPPDDVVLASPHTVLKTSSGKIRRSASHALYARGRIGKHPTAVWWQWTRLALAGILPQWRRLWHTGAEVGYAASAWTLFGLLAPLAWGAVLILPHRRWRWSVLQGLIRLALHSAGMPRLVQGVEHIPQQPCVLVANHASYLDAFVLVATLPGDLCYVAKQELAQQPLAGVPLRRLGTAFVERFDVQQGIEDTARVLQRVRQGRSVVFFPEGTLSREPGLHPFHMGAFVVAVQAGVPVVPVALRGTRSLLHPGHWFLRRGAVRLTIGALLIPTGTDWRAALQVRDAARAHILQYCGEADLATS